MNKSKQALIIFARKPTLGKVKTRLAATLGEAKALEIYSKLLAHTRAVIAKVDCDKYVFLTQEVTDDFWQGFDTEIQQGNILGERMQYAFDLLFNKGYEKVLIIGTDCPAISTKIVSSGFEKLQNHDVVIGPAEDGGYYLLGMSNMYNTLFENISWSSELVCNQTIEKIKEQNLSHTLLQTLNDVDEERDVPEHWL